MARNVREHLDELTELFRERQGHSPVFEQMVRMWHLDLDFWLDKAKCETVSTEMAEAYLKAIDERTCEQIRVLGGVPSGGE